MAVAFFKQKDTVDRSILAFGRFDVLEETLLGRERGAIYDMKSYDVGARYVSELEFGIMQ